ncbi:MAG: DUF2207 domain-containing protein [Patescibacteria group bacterium]|jgi:uncharacterized membrane protein
MKKGFSVSFFLSTLLFAAGFALPASAEVIHSFVSEVVVGEDGTLTVTETISYDFEDIERHGIYRDIPYQYERNGFKYNSRIDVQEVFASGTNVPYEVSRSGGDVSVQIGDANILISGEQEYTIIYTVGRAMNWFDGEPEVYWNVTGDGWDVSIEYARVTVSGVAAYDTERGDCFTGSFGSQEQACSLQTDDEGTALTAFTTEELYPYEGLTVVARLPAGSIAEPTALERTVDFLRDNWGFALPIFTFFILWFLYQRFGKDPKGRGTIIAQYGPPEGMSPTMLGYLVDESIDPRDISAGIIGLAVKGYIKIHYVKKKRLLKDSHTYELEQLKKPGKELTTFENELQTILFAGRNDRVKLDDLKKTFPLRLKSLHKTLHNEAETYNYFGNNPRVIKSLYYSLGVGLAFVSFYLIGGNIGLFIGFLLSGGFILAFANAMPRKTEKGVLAREHILGFKDFLTVTEKDRLKFHNAPAALRRGSPAGRPEVKPEQFMEFLPYAMALSIEKEWAEQFRGLTVEQPNWYDGQDWSTFNTIVFVSAMSDFDTTAKSQAFTAPNSGGGGGSSGFGGGGFSGGGFGGGGGGSW